MAAIEDDIAAAPDARDAQPPLAYRLSGGQWLAIDCVAAAVATAAVFVGFRHGVHFHAPSPVTEAFALAATSPVAVRRIWPVPVFALVTVGCASLTALGRLPDMASVMLGMAAYMAAARYRRPFALALLTGAEGALGAGLLAAAATSAQQVDWVRSLVVCGAMWFVGDSVRERRRYLAGLAGQAEQRRRAEAQRGLYAVAEERLRIARELHDVVAHSLSMVTIQAGVGRKVGAARPVEALRALRAVEVSGRTAMEELRRILGLLRDGAEQASLAPVPGIDDLDELAETVRCAGVPVALEVAGDTAVLSPGAAMTVYRVIQEALTNVVKHAPGAQARVQVLAGKDGVAITVTDTGSAAGPAEAGRQTGMRTRPDQHGIVGMRERAAVFGGTLDAGPDPGGGFRVAAFLPGSGRAAGQVA
jgi:signal transduction histidine kinase